MPLHLITVIPTQQTCEVLWGLPQASKGSFEKPFWPVNVNYNIHNCSCSTLKEEEDAVVDKLVTDVRDSIDPPFLRLDSEP